MSTTSLAKPAPRESGLELFRILFMLLIVIHHYVVNSGVYQAIELGEGLTVNGACLLVLGGWGKIGINCFVLITGYFMCTSQITLQKFLRLLLWVLFYHYLIWGIFFATGYVPLSLKTTLKVLIPFRNISYGFTTAYLVFFLFIPFLNILIRNMTQRIHLLLLALTLGVYTFWASLPHVNVLFGYVAWFMILYVVASYLRLYPLPEVFNKYMGGGILCVSLALLCCASILITARFEILNPYFFVADSNKPLALAFSVSAFLYFKNLKFYSKFINTVALSAFGVLLIHAHSDAMRQWLWRDLCNNVTWIDSPYCLLHIFGVCIIVYIVCSAIDYLRLRYLEQPMLAKALALCNKLSSYIAKIQAH